MRRAISLARKGSGWTNPNPMVGALLVRNDRIIGEGYHDHFGGPHAEVDALLKATEPVEGATLVVTLEPCNHHGKTPPCAPLIVDKGISRVIIGMEDPNPLVKGKGIAFLKEHGVEVITGVLEKDCVLLNEIYIKYITSGLPFVLLKSAVTFDGKTATVMKASRWITSEYSRNYVHKLRQQYSAVMVGAETVLLDDPLLNIRSGRKTARNPFKIIADSQARIPLTARIFQHDPQLTIIATTSHADPEKCRNIERLGAQVILCPLKDNKVDLMYLMRAIRVMNIDSVMLEGGGTLAFSAIKEGIVDKVMNIIAPKILGGTLAPTAIDGEGIGMTSDAILLEEMNWKKLGPDLLIEAYIKN